MAAPLRRRGRVVAGPESLCLEFSAPACPGCAGGCGLVSPRAARQRLVPLSAIDDALPADLRPGDEVTVDVHPQTMNRLALACFGMPVAALAVCAWLAQQSAPALGMDAELAAGAGGLAGLALALTGVGLAFRRNGAMLRGMLKLSARVEAARGVHGTVT